MRRACLLSTIGFAMLTRVAAAIAPIPTPVPANSARPLVVNRPIFQTSAPVKTTKTATPGPGTVLKKHRQPIPMPKKDGGKTPTGAASTPINRSTPLHRQGLGW